MVVQDRFSLLVTAGASIVLKEVASIREIRWL